MHRLTFPSAFSLFLISSCASGGPDQASPKVLNSTAYFKVADRVFVAPVAEVGSVTQQGDCNCVAYDPSDEDRGRTYSEELARDAGQRSKPVEAGHVTINPGQTFEVSGANVGCASSSVSWQCRAARSKVPSDLPRSFTIADIRFLKQFESHFTVGGEKVSNHLADLAPITHGPKIACDKTSKFCTAALKLSPHAIAIWDVWQSDRSSETAIAMAVRQGRAIAIVTYGG